MYVPETQPRYSLTEANELLKLVRVIAAEMLERRAERHALARRREHMEAAHRPHRLRDALARLDARIWEHDEALRACTRELQDLGLTLLRTQPLTLHIPGRSLEPDHQQGDRDVVFCWQEGEGDLKFGHPLGEEEHHRRPLRVAKGA
jgi:hypothetical protein